MLWPGSELFTAANGHLILSWPDADFAYWTLLCAWLRVKHGLQKQGQPIVSFDDVILPDLVGNGIHLESGWDCWIGYHLLAKDGDSDDFLRMFSGKESIQGIHH
jgi:hypothetical protein